MPHLEDFQIKGRTTSNDPIRIDAMCSQCPGPIMSIATAMRDAQLGKQVMIDVTHTGFKQDAIAC